MTILGRACVEKYIEISRQNVTKSEKFIDIAIYCNLACVELTLKVRFNRKEYLIFFQDFVDRAGG